MSVRRLFIAISLLAGATACTGSPSMPAVPTQPHFDTGYGVGSGNRSSGEMPADTTTTTTMAVAPSGATAGTTIKKR